jgi:hypothetical protein
MLLTMTTTAQSATDLGYLLAKNPYRTQSFDLNFGKAHVFYPEAMTTRCTAALLLDLDALSLVRGRDGRDRGERLRSRALGAKRSLARREFALGVEALERFVRGESLRRVHACVFGVLALESEPVDPRL